MDVTAVTASIEPTAVAVGKQAIEFLGDRRITPASIEPTAVAVGKPGGTPRIWIAWGSLQSSRRP